MTTETFSDPPDIEATLVDAATQLEGLVTQLCRQFNPFPAFLGMATIQAVELDPQPNPNPDLGCVVLTPDGSIAQLDVTAIPGIVGVLEVDQVEQFSPLELTSSEYLIYLTEAVRVLTAELVRRRG